jgi:hypothetical protein
MTIDDAVTSRDGLTLYYTIDSSGDIYVSTRSSTGNMFDAGTLLFAGAGTATYPSNDGCEVYMASPPGSGDIRVARRPK